MKNYELIEHTADVGIRVEGKTLDELFKNAGLALFDIIAKQKKNKNPSRRIISISQKADTLDELFVNWLNELLSLSATKELIFTDFTFQKLDNNILKAKVSGSDIKNYQVDTEVKAATYHALKIEKTESGWQAQIIFDV